jgi:hypothetical protein
VADVLAQTPLNISFRRDLREDKWEAWLHLVERLIDIFNLMMNLIVLHGILRRLEFFFNDSGGILPLCFASVSFPLP